MKIDVSFRTAPGKITENTRAVHEAFGIGLSGGEFTVFENFDFEIRFGEIALVTGPSGSGKSSLLRAFRKAGKCLDLNDVEEKPGAALIDQFDCGFEDALRLLNSTGLGEAFLFLRRPAELSDGQRYRFRLAKAISMKPEILLVDEYCAALDRLLAKVISCNLRKTVTREKFSVIAASSHDDFISDLQPDVTVRKSFGAGVSVERSVPVSRRISFFENLSVVEGSAADWKFFAPFHYKSHNLGAVDRIFTLNLSGEPVGIAVYAYPSLANRLRNRVTRNRYSGKQLRPRLALMNRELRVLQRIVLDGRFRGLGLGAHLVRESAARIEVPFIECLTVMGGYSRFLEKAGFVRIGKCPSPREGRLIAAHFREAGIAADKLSDPDRLVDSVSALAEKRPDVLAPVKRWWEFRNTVKGGPKRKKKITGASLRENLKPVLRMMAVELFSAPYYFFLDNRDNNGIRT